MSLLPSVDISKLNSFVSQAKSLASPQWTSRKFLVTVALVGTLLFLCKGAILAIIWPVTVLAGLWLVCTTVTDVYDKKCQKDFKSELLAALAKAGLTPEEITVLDQTVAK